MGLVRDSIYERSSRCRKEGVSPDAQRGNKETKDDISGGKYKTIACKGDAPAGILTGVTPNVFINEKVSSTIQTEFLDDIVLPRRTWRRHWFLIFKDVSESQHKHLVGL